MRYPALTVPSAGIVERSQTHPAPDERLVDGGHNRIIHVVKIDLDRSVRDLPNDLHPVPVVRPVCARGGLGRDFGPRLLVYDEDLVDFLY